MPTKRREINEVGPGSYEIREVTEIVESRMCDHDEVLAQLDADLALLDKQIADLQTKRAAVAKERGDFVTAFGLAQ